MKPTILALRLPPAVSTLLRSAAAGEHLPLSTWVRQVAIKRAEELTAARAPAVDPELADGQVVTPQAPAGEPITYRVVEASELRPSHDPWSFTPSPDYPPGVQEREYHRQTEEQAKVIMGAQKLDPRLVLTDTPTATDGPPLVTGSWRHDGPPLVTDDVRLVLGGNGRSMMLLRAFGDPEKLATYKAALVRKAPAFGIDRGEVRRMTAPVLVRVVHGLTASSPKRELVAAVRRFNEGLTQGLSARARAVAEAGTLSEGALGAVAALLDSNPDATLRDLMRDRGPELVGILRRDGIINAKNSSELVAAGSALTNVAKDRIEAMFLGRVLGTGDRYAQTPPAMLAKLERLVPALVKVQALNPAADQVPAVQAAIDLLNDAARRGVKLEELARQTSLLGEGPPPAERVALARLVRDEGPVRLAARFARWASLAAVDPRQGGMFGAAPSPAELAAALLR